MQPKSKLWEVVGHPEQIRTAVHGFDHARRKRLVREIACALVNDTFTYQELSDTDSVQAEAFRLEATQAYCVARAELEQTCRELDRLVRQGQGYQRELAQIRALLEIPFPWYGALLSVWPEGL